MPIIVKKYELTMNINALSNETNSKTLGEVY